MHATRGTCADQTCEHYTVCHCGCKSPTRIATQNRLDHPAYGTWVKGQPMMWVDGTHASRAQFWEMRLAAGSYVPLDRVRPMIDLLRRHHGSMKAAAEAIGMSYGTLSRIRYQRNRQTCFARTAEPIVAAVLALRTPVDPFAEYEPRRFPTAWERDRSRREEIARDRAKYRKQRVKREAS